MWGCVGSLPRNKKQICNLKLRSKPSPNMCDPLFAIMEQCKQEESQVDPFICNVQGAPDMQCAFWPTIGNFMTWSDFAVIRNFFQ